MTVARGAPWGEPVEAPAELQIVVTDRDARDVVVRQRELGATLPPIGLAGGDLAKTMGGGRGRFAGMVTKAPIDVVRVEAGDRVTWAVAHMVARGRLWRGEVCFIMNAQFLGRYDVAPRAHPNDGKVDILHVAAGMSWRARRAAARRARAGMHLPHPDLSMRQVGECLLRFKRPLALWVDGQRWGTANEIRVTVEPDALIVFA